MFAKFVIYSSKKETPISDKEGNTENAVVPYSNQIFEGDRFEYEKICMHSVKDFEKFLDEYGPHDVAGFFPDIDQAIKSNKEKGFEVILLTVHCGDKIKNYISGENSILYVMNDKGSTIDKIACKNNIL